MNCLNSFQQQITNTNQIPPLVETITTSTNLATTSGFTKIVEGNVYTYTFPGTTSTLIRKIAFNQPIPSMNVIVVAGGGSGQYGSSDVPGGGGAGGGFGLWNFSYIRNTTYTLTVAKSTGNSDGADGVDSSFLSSTGSIGVTANGGQGGARNANAASPGGDCVKTNSAGGTLTAKTGGGGQANSSGSITVLGKTYNYGGGGRKGGDSYGGDAGSNGVGGTGYNGTSIRGQIATSYGSGGGGRS